MINLREVVETNEMIDKENLDVRTITLGISLLDCIDSDLQRLNDRIYHKIYDAARDLVRTGEEISKEFGIPIVNKRISVTPIGLIGGAACKTKEDFVEDVLKLAEKGKSEEFQSRLMECARANDWKAKAAELKDFIKEGGMPDSVKKELKNER